MAVYWLIQLASAAILAGVVLRAVRRYKTETDALTAALLARGFGTSPTEDDARIRTEIPTDPIPASATGLRSVPAEVVARS